MKNATLPLHKIVEPTNAHRIEFNDEKQRELEASISRIGLINPITVRQRGEVHEIIAGHRRFLAHQALAKPTIECKVLEPDDVDNDEATRFAENFERADLTPMEEAVAVERAYSTAGMTVEAIAKMTNRSIRWVEQRLALLSLPADLAAQVHSKRLAINAALELADITDDEHRQYLLRYTLDAGATYDVVRSWVHEWRAATARGVPNEATLPPMPMPGQITVLQIPCYVCHTSMRHDHLRIIRTCPDCTHAIAGSGAEPTTTTGEQHG